jgi:DNA-binding beta-propeller fold protein YncE
MAASGWSRRSVRLGVALCAALLGTMSPAAQASRFAYVGDAGTPAAVVPFAIGAGGRLAALAPAAMPAANADPSSLAATPDGRYVYATDENNGAVAEFAVNADGTLRPLGFVPIATGTPRDIAVSPNGRSVYVAGGDVYQFDVGADGRLMPKGVPFLSDANSAYSVILGPDGRHAYAGNHANGTIAQYNVAGDGSLTPMTTPEVAAGGDTQIVYLVMTPRSLYAVINSTPARVAQLTVGIDGALTPNSPATVATGAGPWGAALSAGDGSLWVATSAGVSQYYTGSQGTLFPKSPAIFTGAKGGYMIWPTAEGGPTAAGTSVYVPDAATGVDQLDAASADPLSPKSPPSASTGNPASATRGIVVLPDQGPVASFIASPAAPGSPTAFDGSGSVDVDGSVAIYDWDFGDGAAAINAGAHPSHTYAAPGIYTVSLTEFDDAGCTMYEIYTGHTAYCAGTAAATTRRLVNVASPTIVEPPAAITPPAILGPPAATRSAARAFTAHVRQRRAQGPPYRYLFSGRLVLPRGMTRRTGCRGQVSVQIKTGPNTISARRATITPACTWRLAVALRGDYRFRNRHGRLGRRGTLRVAVRFSGNRALSPRAAPPFTIRFA